MLKFKTSLTDKELEKVFKAFCESFNIDERDERNYKNMFEVLRDKCVAGFEGKKVVCFAHVTKTLDMLADHVEGMWITSFFVSYEFRGEGYSAKLMDFIESYVKERMKDESVRVNIFCADGFEDFWNKLFFIDDGEKIKFLDNIGNVLYKIIRR